MVRAREKFREARFRSPRENNSSPAIEISLMRCTCWPNGSGLAAQPPTSRAASPSRTQQLRKGARRHMDGLTLGSRGGSHADQRIGLDGVHRVLGAPGRAGGRLHQVG